MILILLLPYLVKYRISNNKKLRSIQSKRLNGTIHMMKLTYIFALLFFCIWGCKPEQSQLMPVTQDFCSEIHATEDMTLDDALYAIKDSMVNQTGVFVLEEGNTSLLSRAWLSEHAASTIDVQYFIFSTDNLGLIACDYLVRAADRGVTVRIIVDDIMVDAEVYDIVTLDAHPNIEIKIYNPGVNLGRNLFQKIQKFTTDFRSANQRMHNKTFIVDNKISITGGRNVQNEYFDFGHEFNYLDRDVLLLGNIVPTITNSFNDFWNYDQSIPVNELIETKHQITYDSTIFDPLHQYACNPENFRPEVREEIRRLPEIFGQLIDEKAIVWTDSVFFISDDPGKNDGTEGLGGGGQSTTALMDLIQEAQHSVTIQSPYLVTTELSRDLFKATVDRGVTVRILTNSLGSTDNLEAFSGYQRDREELLETGVEIYEFKPDAAIRKERMKSILTTDQDFSPIFGLHTKTMVVDDHISVVGTFNLDPRSANLNTECLAIFYSNEITARIKENVDQEMLPENAWRVTKDFNPDKEVSTKKRVKTWTRKILPKDIL